MSYLEKRLGLSSSVETVKPGNAEAYGGKLTTEEKYFQNNIAKYRHSFNLWKSYTDSNMNTTTYNLWIRCKNGCVSDGSKRSGNPVPVNSAMVLTCITNCGLEHYHAPRIHNKV